MCRGHEALKIYCDTDTLFHNVRPADAKTAAELAALEQLLVLRPSYKYTMLRSRVNLRELMATADETQRNKLLGDYDALEAIPADEKVAGFFSTSDQLGGFGTFPMVSDVQSEKILDQLVQRGLGRRDAEHLAQAIYNGCDVFLTRDEATIINRHRGWIESQFPSIKIMRPTELLERIKRVDGKSPQLCSTPTA